MKLLNGLNDAQRTAVISNAPVILTLAGAGTGKTRTLTHRVAYLNQECRVGTGQMLALTFTRLAGKEMKERVISLIGEEQGKKLFCNTFHAFAVLVLRRWGHKVGLEPNFTIYDQEDRESILKTIIEEFGGKVTLKKVMQRYENCEDMIGEKIMFPEEFRILVEYGYRLRQNNAVDLDRLIDLVNRLWERFPESLLEYQNNYTYVFIDEFQDTSDDQKRMINFIAPKNLFVVGDDFQAIYGWRGARVDYILRFPEEYPGCEVIKLEDNYRSTRAIVAAANRLISFNTNQTEKKLIAHKDGVEIYTAVTQSSAQEALVAARNIEELICKGIKPQDIAILARTNRQIKNAVFYLDGIKIPTQIVSGSDDPFKKNGVRGMLEFMEFLNNKKDNHTYKKCLDFSLRKYSEIELQEIELLVYENGCSLYEATCMCGENSSIYPFRKMVEEIEMVVEQGQYTKASQYLKSIDLVLGITEKYNQYGQQNRVDDIKKAIVTMENWEQGKRSLWESDSVQSFLKFLKYRDIQEKLIEEKPAVKLMTVHASKGLEFDTVFVLGLNQGVFPSKSNKDEEEERRLCYVALTRAKNRLVLCRSLTYSDWQGKQVSGIPSQYLSEI